MTTAITTAPAPTNHDATNRRTSADVAWLLAAPLTALIARTMWTPFDDEEPVRYITEVGQHPSRSGFGALLMILSALLLIPAALAVAASLRTTRPRLARTAVGMIVTGAVGMAAFSMIGLFAPLVATNPDRTAMLTLWDQLIADDKGELIFLAILTGAIGFIVLAVGLFRSHTVPRPAAILVGLGGATTLFTTGGPLRPLLLTAAALALVGFGWIAVTTQKPVTA